MKNTRALAGGLLAVLIIFASCGAEQGPEGTLIKIRIMNEIKNADKALARYREMVKNDSVMRNIHPVFKWTTGGDYRDKLSMALVAREDYDLMFCGSWHGLSTLIQQECFADLSGYFNNDAYPGLKRAFPPDFVRAMTSWIPREDGSYRKGIYGINLAEYFEDTRGIIYREDLRKQYHCKPVRDEASFINFLDTVLAGEKAAGKEWLGLNLYNFFRVDTPWYAGKTQGVFAQESTNVLGDQTHVYIGIGEDGKTVLNAVFPGDSAEEFAKMPAGYRYDFIAETAAVRAGKWNRFLSPMRGTGEMELREYLAEFFPLSEFESRVQERLDRYPNAEYGFYVIEEDQRGQKEGAVINDMITNNWLVVPAWSKNIDAVMRFLDWMFGAREHHDLFHYGIEGEDWQAIGDDSYRPLAIDEKRKYVMPVYSLTLNPSYIRKSAFVKSRPDIDRRFDYMYNMATYRLSPLAGFSFNAAMAQTEIANVSALSNELQLSISRYGAEEAAMMIKQWHEGAEKAGLEKIRAELVRQLQDFLDAKHGENVFTDSGQ